MGVGTSEESEHRERCEVARFKLRPVSWNGRVPRVSVDEFDEETASGPKPMVACSAASPSSIQLLVAVDLWK